jgi:hypothetical protein
MPRTLLILVAAFLAAAAGCGAGGGLSLGDTGACNAANSPGAGNSYKNALVFRDSSVTNKDIKNEIAKITYTSSADSDAQAAAAIVQICKQNGLTFTPTP